MSNRKIKALDYLGEAELEQIHKAGNTIVVVTHEETIARHAHRIIRLIDGMVESDEINKNVKTMADYVGEEVMK